MAVWVEPQDIKTNSYVSLDEANYHLDRRPHTEVWDATSQVPGARGYVVDGATLAGATTVNLRDGEGEYTAGNELIFAGQNTVYTVDADTPSPTTSVSFTPPLELDVPDGAGAWRFTPNDREAGLIWATFTLDAYMDWYGARRWASRGSEGPGPFQNLRWPRSGVQDLDGYTYDFDTVPMLLRKCTAEQAMYGISRDLVSLPGLLGLGFKKAEIPGPLKVEVDPNQVENPVYDYILTKLRPLGTLGSWVGSSRFRIKPLFRS